MKNPTLKTTSSDLRFATINGTEYTYLRTAANHYNLPITKLRQRIQKAGGSLSKPSTKLVNAMIDYGVIDRVFTGNVVSKKDLLAAITPKVIEQPKYPGREDFSWDEWGVYDLILRKWCAIYGIRSKEHTRCLARYKHRHNYATFREVLAGLSKVQKQDLI